MRRHWHSVAQYRFVYRVPLRETLWDANIIYELSVLLFHADSRADIKYRMHPQNGTNCWPTWCPLFILLLISRTLFTLGISPSLSSSLVYILFPIVAWLSLVKFWIRSISWFALRNFPFCINLILFRQSSVLRNPLLETKIKSRYTDSLMYNVW